MTLTWEEQRDKLCKRIEQDFDLEKFSNWDLPIVALTSNDRISKDEVFKNRMKKNGAKDLATIGDTVIDFVIIDHYLDEIKNATEKNQAQDLNMIREKFGNNYALHFVAKNPPVNLGDYIVKTGNERCAETGTKCLAMYFEALVAIIYIEHGITAAKRFFKTISFFENVKKL